MSEARLRQQITFRYEWWRAITAGILETAGTTFLLLIAVRHFQAGANAKSLISVGGSFGLMFSPLVVSLVERSGWAPARAAAGIAFAGGLLFLLAAAVTWLPVFVLSSVLAMACASAIIPLLTQIYQENYPEKERGRLFSRTQIVRIATTVAFGHFVGSFLDGHMERFQLVVLMFAGAFGVAGFCLGRCPSYPLKSGGRGSHPLRALHYAKEDPVFRMTLISWMFLGFGTLIMQPMRVEYLANPRYGQHWDVTTIALVTVVVPNFIRLLLSPVWGWLFDHMNFFVLRMVLNLGFALGILAFFVSDSFNGLIWGAVIFGIANAGGDVAWSLWVTKFAAPDRVADYMSVHTCFTGLRGVIAPFIGFQLIQSGVSLPTLGWGCAGLVGVAILLLIPEIKKPIKRQGTILVEEVSE